MCKKLFARCEEDVEEDERRRGVGVGDILNHFRRDIAHAKQLAALPSSGGDGSRDLLTLVLSAKGEVESRSQIHASCLYGFGSRLNVIRGERVM